MIAGVIISKNARELDKTFDYSVPPELEDKVKKGVRVIVPFGKKNLSTEGFVVCVSEKKPKRNLKEIISVDDACSLDEKSVELARYIKEETLCTYSEALFLMVPAGSGAKFEQWVFLNEGYEDKAFSDTQAKVIKALLESGGSSELMRLMSFFEENVRAAVTQLEKKGAVTLKQFDTRQIKEKTVRYASLSVEGENMYAVEEELKKRAPKQSRILSILKYNDKVALSELTQLADASYNAVSALVKKGYITLFDDVVKRSPETDAECAFAPELTEEQRHAFDRIYKSVSEEKNEKFLLFGVTGSGKTEVYISLIEKVLKSGKGAIVLVPEISLTPLMTKRFISRFGKNVAILHSALSLGERYDEWQRIKSGEARIVVGARSAIFAPVDKLGIIILDEEHEGTYKSETSPRYHARDVAVFRAEQHACPVVFASATPSVESFYKAKRGEYTLLRMQNRATGAKLPYVYVVDMRQELEAGNRSMFSSMLSDELLYNKEHGEQSILFLNRRGFSTFVSCRECGYVAMCPHCNISLTYHRYTNKLVCHYCGYTHDNYSECPSCKSKYIKFFGAGTQKLEEELKKQFDNISIVRMDVDTTSTKSAHRKLLNKFEKEKCDVLLGTQMVSKGLDFENVTLVGVVAADTSLYIDDYRSSERTFCLMEQVAGRAGRGKKEGRAVVQTYSPENSAIVYAKRHDYEGFYNEEIKMRKAAWYPPFSEIVTVLLSGAGETMVSARIREIAKQLHFYLDGGNYGKTLILGPAKASVSKIKDKYRYRIVIKCESARALTPVLKKVIEAHTAHENRRFLSLVIDKNPNNLA